MERIFDDQAALNREEERKAKARATLKKFREKEKREKLEREKRFEHLRRENQYITQRTAVYREVVIKRYHIPWFISFLLCKPCLYFQQSILAAKNYRIQ